MVVASFGVKDLGCTKQSSELERCCSDVVCLLQQILCKQSLVPITSCLTVTVAGAWGSVGDRIQVIRWFDTAQLPPTSFIVTYINENTNSIVTGITPTNTQVCSA